MAPDVPLTLLTAPSQLWHEVGQRHLQSWQYGAARTALEHAAISSPEPGAVDHHLAEALFELGHTDAAVARFERAATSQDMDLRQSALRSLAIVIPGAPRASAADILRARQAWAPRSPNSAPEPTTTRGKLRIGYVSAFFGARNWMKPVWGLINHHDRALFEVHMFADRTRPSCASGYQEFATDVIHGITGVSNERLAEIIRSLGIDILIDLNGYSHADRLALYALRPAAKIVGWFNMFATTGMPAFDWLVADSRVITPAEEHHYAERIHRLPGSYLAFDVRYEVPPVAPPPSIDTGYLTLGCLGSQHKLTDPVLTAWGQIMRGTPTARLLVRNATLEDASCRTDLLSRLHKEGVTTERITLEGRAEHFDFLRTYDRIDIALDTFPYNGGTTTTEALWQGVPVLTFDGDRWASRTSLSVLAAAGLDDWVTPTVDDYVQRAITLGNSSATPPTLATLRAELRTTLRRSAVCDTATLCRAMEAFYQQIA